MTSGASDNKTDSMHGANAVPLKKLANVPVSEYSDVFGKGSVSVVKTSPIRRLLGWKKTPDYAGTRTYRLHFNAALWLRFYRAPTSAIGFWLEYEDASGLQTVLVDQSKVQEAGQLMLAGQVSLLVVGFLASLRAGCSGIKADEHYRVEELFVQRQYPQASQADRATPYGARMPKPR
jgi:hypothetical protein